ncbi:MAG: ABC transporter substrate-binding protein [Chloroflexi bacterium]|nr:ABC transporter substrate-binding protein [Chloroflexota bacterium]
MRTWRWISVLAVLVLVLAACGQQGQSPSESEETDSPPSGSGAPEASEDAGAGEPQTGGTLVFGGSRLATSLDPVLTSDGESFRVLQQVYETLVDLAPGSTNELVGALAESWEGEPDGTEYVFHLRENATFHDGEPFNADAVVANFERWQGLPEEMQGSAYYYDAVFDGFGDDNLMASIEATDEFTVTLTLREPNPAFLYGITLPAFGLVSPAILESTNASDASSTLGTDVVQAGTGPFILEDYVPEDSATLARNDDYWDTPAYLDSVIIRPNADAAARLQALQGGSVQGFDLVNPADYETVESEGFSLVHRQSFNTLYLAITPTARDTVAGLATDDVDDNERTDLEDVYAGETSPLQDLAVREAVAMAIDREALIGPFYGGRGAVADTFIPETSQWSEDVLAGVEPVEYSAEGAADLLEQAGFGPDNPPTIHFWYPTEVTRPYMPDPRGLHEAIVQMLEDAGFVVESHSDIWDDPGYLFDAQNGYYDMHFLGWTGDWDDPGNFYGIHFGYSQGEPAAQFGCDVDGLEDAITTADGEVDPTTRGEAWADVAGLVHDNVCFVTIAHGDTALAFTSEVQGYEPNPTGSESFKNVWLSGE